MTKADGTESGERGWLKTLGWWMRPERLPSPISAKPTAEAQPRPVDPSMWRWLLSVDTLPSADPPAASPLERPSKRSFLRWLVGGETLPTAARAAPDESKSFVGWFFGRDEFPKVTPSPRASQQKTLLGWLLSRESLSSVAQPKTQERANAPQ